MKSTSLLNLLLICLTAAPATAQGMHEPAGAAGHQTWTTISLSFANGPTHELSFETEPSTQQIQQIESKRDIPLLYCVAHFYDNKRNYDVASAHYRKVVELDPRVTDEDKVLFIKSAEELGYIYGIKGQYSGAIYYLSQAIKLRPLNPMDFQNRAAAYQRVGDAHSSQMDMAMARRLNTQPPPNDYYSQSLSKMRIGMGSFARGQPGKKAQY